MQRVSKLFSSLSWISHSSLPSEIFFFFPSRLRPDPLSDESRAPWWSLSDAGDGHSRLRLQVKELLEDAHRVIGRLDGVSNGARVAVDFPVVAAFKGLVAKEVDLGVGNAARLLGLLLEVLEAVGLVPAPGEDVEGDLAADGVPAGEGVFPNLAQAGTGARSATATTQLLGKPTSDQGRGSAP